MAISGNTEKYYIMKVYDSSGNFKEIFDEKEFSDKLSFSISVNGTLSAMSLATTLNYDDWVSPTGRLANIDIGDRCKFWIFDKEYPDGKQVYSGIFSGIEIEIVEKNESLKMNFLPNSILLGKKLLRATNGENTTKAFSSTDPSDMMRYIIYNANVGIGYNVNTIRNTGVSRTYEFISQYCLEGIKKVLDLCPYGWFFYIGGDDKAYLKDYQAGEPSYSTWGTATWGTSYWEFDPATDSVIVHQLNFETQLRGLSAYRHIEEMTNRVVFLGGGTPQLFLQYETTSSINSYGLFEELQSDERVTDSGTAESFSQRILDGKNLPKATYQCEVIDSNYSKNGYDIESLKVGDLVRINSNRNDGGYTEWGDFVWGSDLWRLSSRAILGVEQFIKKITYNQDSAILELSLAPDPIVQRIEDINRDLTNFRFVDAPDVPTNI